MTSASTASTASQGLAGTTHEPDDTGHFGRWGGRYMPEALIAAVDEVAAEYEKARHDPAFLAELDRLQRDYAGRPSPVTDARRLSEHAGGARILLKREDLNHTGSHKINNVLGQALLTKRMGKTRVIAETGAGQHGVATATAAALMGLECMVYMGEVDTERQALNVARMRLLGAEVVPVTTGSRTLKDALNEAYRDWVASVGHTHYILGTAAGPHPFPMMVRDFHRVIGLEAREQVLAAYGRLPDAVVACVGGGSNAIGIFHPFLDDADVRLIGYEAAGDGVATGRHAASITGGTPGALHGAMSYLLQDEDGQTLETHSISAGLDYPGVGPEHAFLADSGRASYEPVTDAEAMEAFRLLCRTEGIIPAIESAHAIAGAVRLGQDAGSGGHDPGQPLRPGRQGRRHRRALVRGGRRGRAAHRGAGHHRRGERGAGAVTTTGTGITRLAEVFTTAKAEDRAALIAYLPSGYPTIKGSLGLLTQALDAGADLVEVGLPYSDPVLDGPVIQHAVDAALKGGVRVRDTLAIVEQLAERGGRAVVMTYWNPVLRYGVDAFARDLAAAGGLGVITPDLVPDEAGELARRRRPRGPRPDLPRRAVVVGRADRVHHGGHPRVPLRRLDDGRHGRPGRGLGHRHHARRAGADAHRPPDRRRAGRAQRRPGRRGRVLRRRRDRRARPW